MSDLILPTDVMIDVRLANKSLLLKELAAKAAISVGLSPEQVEPYLPKREELGSTCISGGVAIPHARQPDVNGRGAVSCPRRWFARTATDTRKCKPQVKRRHAAFVALRGSARSIRLPRPC
jgi:hypothetical protein